MFSTVMAQTESCHELMIQLINSDLIQSFRLMKHETVNISIVPIIIICKFNEIRSLIPECIAYLLMQSTVAIQMVEITFSILHANPRAFHFSHSIEMFSHGSQFFEQKQLQTIN